MTRLLFWSLGQKYAIVSALECNYEFKSHRGWGEIMDEKKRKEYLSVVMGALLHDIGKFMQRAELEKLYAKIVMFNLCKTVDMIPCKT